MKHRLIGGALLLLTTVAVSCTLPPATHTARAQDASASKAVPVRLTRSGTSWQLLRDGKPYFIKGAGGVNQLERLVASGGNSVRTWGLESAEKDLESAHRHGLTVTLGIWLGHKRHGFKYDDPKAVAEQLTKAREAVLKYRNHPALLAWGIGNEMEDNGRDPQVWKAVEDIARMIKELDPDHPTMTVIAELGEGGIKPQEVARLCPSIDILGVNSYGGAPSVPERLKAAGWSKPYVITEFGPNGPWEVGKTAWGAALEPSSTEKSRMYQRSYEKAVRSQGGWCLGSYVFLWGNKQEVTPTWFGLFLPDTGEKLGPVDTMALAWTGKAPDNRAPEILAFTSTLAQKEVEPGSKHRVECQAQGDKPSPKLTYRYEIRPDDLGNWNPDPGQKTPPAIGGVLPPPGPQSQQTFTAPTNPGGYRLYVYVLDGKGGAATANVPFLVKK